MISSFYTSLHYLTFDFEPVFEIERGFYLTNDNSIKSQVLASNSEIHIGRLETLSIFNISILAFWKTNHVINRSVEFHELDEFMSHVNFLTTALWLEKDNCTYNEIAFLNYGSANQNYHSNFIAQVNTFPDASSKGTLFSKNEMENVRQFYSSISSLMINENQNPFTELIPDSNPISRALYFVQAARMNKEVGVKVMFYCMVLETLFETPSRHVTKHLADAVANFIAIEQDDFNKIRSRIIKAYELRSTTVHGDSFTNSILFNDSRKLVNIAFSIDQIVRNTLRKILSNKDELVKFSCNKYA